MLSNLQLTLGCYLGRKPFANIPTHGECTLLLSELNVVKCLITLTVKVLDHIIYANIFSERKSLVNIFTVVMVMVREFLSLRTFRRMRGFIKSVSFKTM